MKGYTRDFDAKYDDATGKFLEEREERSKPRFWMEDTLDPKTDTITKVEMIEIIVPGEDKNRWAGKVEDKHRQRFHRIYTAWKNNETLPVDGHPLNVLPTMDRHTESTLKHMGFVSIEDLARATDQAIGQFMGGLTWRKKAQIFVDQHRAKQTSESQKDQVIAEQGAQLAALQKQMQELSAAMVESAAKKPGRKPKTSEVPAAA